MRLDNYTRKTLSVNMICKYQYGKGERELSVWRIFDKNTEISTIDEALNYKFNEIKQCYSTKFKPILRQIDILICLITPEHENARLEDPYKDIQGAMLIKEKFSIDIKGQSRKAFRFNYIKTIYDFLDTNLYNENILEKFKEKCCSVHHKNKKEYLKIDIVKFIYFCIDIGYECNTIKI